MWHEKYEGTRRRIDRLRSLRGGMYLTVCTYKTIRGCVYWIPFYQDDVPFSNGTNEWLDRYLLSVYTTSNLYSSIKRNPPRLSNTSANSFLHTHRPAKRHLHGAPSPACLASNQAVFIMPCRCVRTYRSTRSRHSPNQVNPVYVCVCTFLCLAVCIYVRRALALPPDEIVCSPACLRNRGVGDRLMDVLSHCCHVPCMARIQLGMADSWEPRRSEDTERSTLVERQDRGGGC